VPVKEFGKSVSIRRRHGQYLFFGPQCTIFNRRNCCYRNVGAVVGGILLAVLLVGLVIVVVVFLRRQWARSEENKARINARLAGEDEILVSSHLIHTYVMPVK